jgi:hypothetical protein
MGRPVAELLVDAGAPENDWSDQLPPLAELVAGLSDIDVPDEDESAMSAAELEQIRLTLSIELEVREDGGRTRVTGSTPTQWTETTVLPAFHRLSMRITRSDDA